ncbi:uncharacterized protein [Physcomitrium patens]|uniref:uncharacterized protein isoform X4 n=1 Tax=Physcomitrium patens TaxID=3218 RepID=UPI003CCCE3E6
MGSMELTSLFRISQDCSLHYALPQGRSSRAGYQASPSQMRRTKQQPAWRGRNADRVREPYAGPDRVGVTARVRVMLKRKVFEEQSIFLLRV